ncbi:MAG: hypothetical protein ABJ360_03520 [Roseobacter sp.]
MNDTPETPSNTNLPDVDGEDPILSPTEVILTQGNQQASVTQLYVFATVFLVILFGTFLVLLFVDIDESTSRFQVFLFITRLICALVAGALVALIPGALEIDWAKRLGIRATGAAAAFVLIWTVNPPSMIKDGVDRLKYSEVLVRCQNGFGDRSPPDISARTNCPLLAKLDTDRWESYYYQGKLDYWDREFADAVAQADQAKSRLASVSVEERIGVSLRINNLQNYARMSSRAPESLRAVVDDNTNFLASELPDGVAPELKLQNVVALLDLDIAEIAPDDLELIRVLLSELSGNVPGAQHWIDFHQGCLHLLEFEFNRDDLLLDKADSALERSINGMRSYMENLAPIQSRMMLCRLVGDSSGCEYRGGDPVLCKFTNHLRPERLAELRILLR